MDAIIEAHRSIGEAVCFCQRQFVIIQGAENGSSTFRTEVNSQVIVGHQQTF